MEEENGRDRSMRARLRPLYLGATYGQNSNDGCDDVTTSHIRKANELYDEQGNGRDDCVK